jgi:hypothetical protein
MVSVLLGSEVLSSPASVGVLVLSSAGVAVVTWACAPWLEAIASPLALLEVASGTNSWAFALSVSPVGVVAVASLALAAPFSSTTEMALTEALLLSALSRIVGSNGVGIVIHLPIG